jgi:hypothetical protein
MGCYLSSLASGAGGLLSSRLSNSRHKFRKAKLFQQKNVGNITLIFFDWVPTPSTLTAIVF